MRVKTLILATSAAGALALSAGAASADPNGWYGAVDAGYHSLGNAETFGNPGPEFDIDVQGDWAGFARLGYRFTPNWRVELEGGYRDNNQFDYIVSPGPGLPTGICNVQPPVGPCLTPEGELSAATLMANVIYDFGDESWSLRPFIGLGAGAARISTNFVGTLGGQRTIGIAAEDHSVDLAAQGILGLAWAIGDRANVDLTYRYLMSNFEYDTTRSVAPQYGTFTGRYDESHTVSLGLRYSFGAEPAPPPPAPT
ncbi:MAG: porin family protein, partial [Brevundimonas sp.]